ncbi:hypothetical protein [Streptomyces sp. NPDC016845]|uniref:hypothetical protein n=1 Tax=Streptomyces sp. NPDC016845 TaxID=3364972 RepID=UPI0037A61674
MIYATVSPAPAERLPRPVARRRALQLALLLGGLIGLGFLCGGQAHAEGASGTLRYTAAQETTGGGSEQPGHGHGVLGGLLGRDGAPEDRNVVGTVRDTVLLPVLDTVQNTVQDTVRGVTEPVGELAGQVVDGLASAAPRPLPGGPPVLPGLPDAPGAIVPLPAPPRPTAPVTPANPAEPPASAGPAGSTDADADTTGSAAPVTSAASGVEAEAERQAPDAARGEPHAPGPYAPGPYALAPAGPTAYDPAGTGAVQENRADAHPHRSSAARHTVAPQPAAPHAPVHPGGVLVAGASAADGGGSRHGDLHAAAFAGRRVSVLLPPGAFASGTAAPVTDRHRDIPVLPG